MMTSSHSWYDSKDCKNWQVLGEEDKYLVLNSFKYESKKK